MYPAGGTLVFAVLLINGIETTRFVPTYQWTDKETGKMVICHQCPPGTYVAKHCTSNSATDCQPCPNEHYTQYWNYVDKCRFCNIICQDREQVKHECNATHNRVCECQPGYQRDSHFCIKECGARSWSSNKDNRECEWAVIEYVVKQNMPHENVMLLENTVVSMHKMEKKPVRPRKIRNLLKYLRDAEPDRPFLPRLLEVVKQAGLHSLESNLKKKFMHR